MGGESRGQCGMNWKTLKIERGSNILCFDEAIWEACLCLDTHDPLEGQYL